MQIQDIIESTKLEVQYHNYIFNTHPNLVNCKRTDKQQQIIIDYEVKNLVNISQVKLNPTLLLLKIVHAVKQLPPEIRVNLNISNIYLDQSETIKFLRRSFTQIDNEYLLELKELTIQLKLSYKIKKKVVNSLSENEIIEILSKYPLKEKQIIKTNSNLRPLVVLSSICVALIIYSTNLQNQITAISYFQNTNYENCNQKFKGSIVTNPMMKNIHSICIIKSNSQIYPKELEDLIYKTQYLPELIIAIHYEDNKKIDEYIELINDPKISELSQKSQMSRLTMQPQLTKKQMRRLNELKNSEN